MGPNTYSQGFEGLQEDEQSSAFLAISKVVLGRRS